MSATQNVKQLALFFARHSADDPAFGKTKLVKLLAFADFLAYWKRGESITGATYVKLEYGPAPRELPTALILLEKDDAIEIDPEDVYSLEQIRIKARKDPDMSGFSEAAIADAHEVLRRFRRWDNSAMSDFSHDQFVGWNMVREMKPIPFHSVYLSPAPLGEDEIRRGQELAAQYGW